MAAAEDWAIAQGATSIELGMYEFNSNAREFYQQLGYSTLHRRMNKALAVQTPIG
jgi:GNAT superfamily N-acetyltransferase